MAATDDRVQAPFDAMANLEQASALVGVAVPSDYRQGVARNLALIAQMADLVMGFPLAPTDEPAPVFVPAEPGR